MMLLLYNHTEQIYLNFTDFKFSMECGVTFRHSSSYVPLTHERGDFNAIQAHLSNIRRNI